MSLFSSDPHPKTVFGHSIWHPFWHIFWYFIWRYTFWHAFLHLFWHIFCHSFWHFIWHLLWHSIWHLFKHSFWHLFRHSIRHSLCPAVPFEIWRPRLRSCSAHWDLEIAVEVRQCTVRSGDCGWGPVVPTEIWCSHRVDKISGGAVWNNVALQFQKKTPRPQENQIGPL